MTELKIERINYRRFLTLLGIVLFTFLFSGFISLYEKLYRDEIYCLIFVDIIFLMIFIFELEYSRSKKQLAENRNTYFLHVLFGYAFCCILSVIFVFLPVYAKPVMMLSVIIFSVSNELIAFITSCYFIIVIGFCVSANYYELISQLIIVILGVVLIQFAENRKYKILLYIPLVAVNVISTVIFYYLEFRTSGYVSIVIGVICAVVSAISFFVCDKYVRPYCNKEKFNLLIDLIAEDYPLVKEIKNDKSNEYNHATLVSTICYKSAQMCGLNPEVCAVGGFYYRLGKWLGEPEIKNSILKAQELCFPQEIIDILYEYYGQIRKPSTPESALVHMVDALVKKLEKIDGEVGKNSWNNEMIIYQTLNEFSASGIYDEAGLSMNHFLKIREYLAKEKII